MFGVDRLRDIIFWTFRSFAGLHSDVIQIHMEASKDLTWFNILWELDFGCFASSNFEFAATNYLLQGAVTV